MEMYKELAIYFVVLSVLGVAGYKMLLGNRQFARRDQFRENLVILFICYVSAVVSLTVIPSQRFSLNNTIPLTNYIPVLNSYKRYVMVTWFENHHGIKNFWQNFIGNIVLFMPLGVFLKVLFRKRLIAVVAIAFLSSFAIESIQYASRFFGYYRHIDIDDVILNTFGAFSGYLGLVLLNRLIAGRKLAGCN